MLPLTKKSDLCSNLVPIHTCVMYVSRIKFCDQLIWFCHHEIRYCRISLLISILSFWWYVDQIYFSSNLIVRSQNKIMLCCLAALCLVLHRNYLVWSLYLISRSPYYWHVNFFKIRFLIQYLLGIRYMNVNFTLMRCFYIEREVLLSYGIIVTP